MVGLTSAAVSPVFKFVADRHARIALAIIISVAAATLFSLVPVPDSATALDWSVLCLINILFSLLLFSLFDMLGHSSAGQRVEVAAAFSVKMSVLMSVALVPLLLWSTSSTQSSS